MSNLFTKRKFLQIEERQRHKHCASILRSIYEKILSKEKHDKEFETYHQYLTWQNLPFFEKTIDLRKISEQYHWHLHLANMNLKEHNLLPHIRKQDRKHKKEFAPHAILLDNIRSAYNVGSILRTTEALRIGQVYFASKTPFIDNKKVEKTSMGSSSIVPCHKDFTLENLPRPFVALETSDDAIDLSKFIFPEIFTLILGNEETGISDALLKNVDELIEIPLYGRKNSINVACAFAIAANEISKQEQAL